MEKILVKNIFNICLFNLSEDYKVKQPPVNHYSVVEKINRINTPRARSQDLFSFTGVVKYLETE